MGKWKKYIIKKYAKKIEDIISQEGRENAEKVIYFDVVKYESLDPISSLMFLISNEYENKNNSKKWNDVIKTTAFLTGKFALKSFVGLDIDKDDFEKISTLFSKAVREIKTLTTSLEKMIGENGKLIILIDELDRCNLESIISVLLSIKILFNAKNCISVVAADFEILEKALGSKYGYNHTTETRQYLEKIFQFITSLPEKKDEDIVDFISQYISSELIGLLILKSSNKNPRKIKRLINFIYFSSILIEEPHFNNTFPLLVLWSVIGIKSKSLIKIFQKNFVLFVSSVIIVNSYDTFQEFKDIKNSNYIFGREEIDVYSIFPEGELIECLKVISADRDLFRLLQLYSEHCGLDIDGRDSSTIKRELSKIYSKYEYESNFMTKLML